MRVAEVIEGLDVVDVRGDVSVDVASVEHDSRSVAPGAMFCCIPGDAFDGHDFATAAIEQGAVALLVERPLPSPVTQVVVPSVRAAVGPVAAAVVGHPSRFVDVVGITGTNGKTTTAQLLARLIAHAERRVEVIGTLTGERTTPEAPDLQRQLASWREEGVEVVVMEVSSHALALHRVDGTRFRVAVFTNLSRDHLDFHESMESYFEAKAMLFRPELADMAVVNLDSPHGRLLRDAAAIPTVGYSLDQAEDLESRGTGSRFRWRGEPVDLGLAGRFNVSNALAAAETARLLGVADPVTAAGLSGPFAVPGRFEVLEGDHPFMVVVDYAHTPDGLAQVLRSASAMAMGQGMVRVLFGCGGDRDPSKRPMMGEVAAGGADQVVLTADNSRGEDTAVIIDAIRAGYEHAGTRRATELLVVPDRRQAIAEVLGAAGPGDVVVIAGKGHETTQTVGERVTEFDDRLVAAEELTRLSGAQR